MNEDKTEISYPDVLESPIYIEFKTKFNWDKMFIHTIGLFLAKKDANGPDLDIDLSPEALLDTMKKSIETGEDLVLPASKVHVKTYEEEFLLDEEDIRKFIENIRKHPVRIRPDLLKCQHWDVFVAKAKSYNRHGYTKDFIDLKGEGFHDKLFEGLFEYRLGLPARQMPCDKYHARAVTSWTQGVGEFVPPKHE